MRVRVLKTFRLSDIVGHKTEIVMLDDKQIKFNLLNEVSIQDFTSQKGLRRLPKATQSYPKCNHCRPQNNRYFR